MCCSVGAIVFAQVFKMMLGMLSGPTALLMLMLLSNFSMPLVVIFTGLSGVLALLFVDGLSLLCFVKTDLNCSTRISALSLLLLNSCPFFFSGCTPILSCLLDLTNRQKGLVFFYSSRVSWRWFRIGSFSEHSSVCVSTN